VICFIMFISRPSEKLGTHSSSFFIFGLDYKSGEFTYSVSFPNWING
jgi:hypothetical protein